MNDRSAVIVGQTDKIETVRRYLPSNYSARIDGDRILIEGTDQAGWTLDGYVIPRLASGLFRAVELPDFRTQDASDQVREEILRITGGEWPEHINFENTGGGCMCLVLDLGEKLLVIGQDDLDVFEYDRATWVDGEGDQPEGPAHQPVTVPEAAHLFLAAHAIHYSESE